MTELPYLGEGEKNYNLWLHFQDQAKLGPPQYSDPGTGGVSGTIPSGGWTMTNTLGNVMSVSVTAPFDCYWATDASVLARNTAAVWDRLEMQMVLSPADVDGYTQANGSIMHHSGASDWNHGKVHRVWKLAAGKSYTVTLVLLNVLGSAFNIYRHPFHTWVASEGIRPR